MPSDDHAAHGDTAPDAALTALLAELAATGVRLSAVGKQLRCQAPPGVLTGQLVARIQQHKTAILAAIRPRAEAVPLSPAQERLWLANQLHPEDTAYHLPLELHLAGPVHPARLRFALSEVIRRHGALRTTFPVVDGEPRLLEARHTRPALAMVDLSGLPTANRAAARDAITTAVATRPFFPDVSPPHRSVLVRATNTDHDLLHTRHHIVADGASLGILATELAAHHAASLAGEPAGQPEPAWQFADAARWQRGQAAEQNSARTVAWRARLADVPTSWQLLTARGAESAATAHAVLRHLDDAVADAVADRARAIGTTAFSVLATAFGLAITSAAAQSAIVVGVPVTGRTRTETTTMIGCFATVAPLCLDYRDDPSFDAAVRVTHQDIGRTFADQDLPAERVLDLPRGRGRAELYAVSLTLQDPPVAAPRLGDATVTVAPLRTLGPKFPLAVTIAAAGSGYRVLAEHDPDRIAATTVGAVLDRFVALLATAVEHPTTRCRALVRRVAARPVWPVPPVSVEPMGALGDHFVDIATRHPDSVAVTDARGSISYRCLLDRATGLARTLCAAGVGAETPVAVCVEHGAALVIALIAVALSGGVAVPLDPEDPAARHESIIETSSAAMLVAGERQERGLRWFDGDTVVIDQRGTTDRRGTVPLPSVTPDQLAYVIHTSGSTGRAKGVMISHGSVLALFDAARTVPAFDLTGTWTLVHSSAFDFSVWELWGPLLHGGRVVVVPRATARDPRVLAELIRDQRVTLHSTTPTAYRALVNGAGHPDVGVVVFGGERIEPTQLRSWLDGGPELINMYGVTETTVHVTCGRLTEVDAASADSPIGTPLPGIPVAVVDRHGAAVVPGGVGELVVGGRGVARGYLGAPALTADRFRPVPGGVRAYRSGDRVRLHPDGELCHLGRLDQQLKLRGHRIEPAEIEAAIVAHPDIGAAVVVPDTDQFGRDCLAAYVVARADTLPGAVVLRRRLTRILPPYMIPLTYTALPELPRTRNGKVDHAALPRPLGSSATEVTEAPATPTEKAIAEVWRDLLDVPAVGRLDDFFALGGDSLLLIRMHARVNIALHTDLTLGETYQAADLATLAAAVDRGLDQSRQGEAG